MKVAHLLFRGGMKRVDDARKTLCAWTMVFLNLLVTRALIGIFIKYN